ncbi:hypothetical protein DFH08DRAFT_1027021 [Mycena albidolilacea]|uniref:ABC transporter family G domain-containing protein n=1 Tax=Mycena albidolilacea TaxID=1033008 RepID=A0AAD7EHT1_9AGAR|nr:hypothetical protein DFH08DRAFT_1027021 [Mycena albidolilacea]
MSPLTLKLKWPQGHQSISGGEKCHVLIACELVTSSSILFFNESTSGLDSYNTFNVVERLISLVRDYNWTVIFTIHQPHSNIVALFDQLVLLAAGKLVYLGEFTNHAPVGFNIAGFLINLTVHAGMDKWSNSTNDSPMLEPLLLSDKVTNLGDEERGLWHHQTPAVPLATRSQVSSSISENEEMELCTGSASAYIKHKTSQLPEAVSLNLGKCQNTTPLVPKLTALVEAYAASLVAQQIREEGKTLQHLVCGVT